LDEIPDYYAVLCVPRDADAVTVRRAYRDLAARHHPDRHPGDDGATARFKALVEAYSVVGDAERRRAYDAGLAAGIPTEARGGVTELVGGIVDRLFGVKERRPRDGRNRRYRLTVSFRDAMLGTPQSLRLPAERTCDTCYGRGFPLGSLPTVCGRCAGSGAVQGRPFLRSVIDPCGSCDGRGYIMSAVCEGCGGEGLVTVDEEVTVQLPAGTSDGDRLRVRGAGEPGRHGGADGDLLVDVTVEPHRVLERDGDDIVVTRPVPVTRAILGGVLDVPTLDGPRSIRLPAGSEDGTVLRMAGFGVPRPDGERGDQRVTLRLELPQALSPEARAAFTTAAAALDPSAYPGSRRFEELDDHEP